MKNQKSFTLIELLVVIAIIGIISSIVLVNLQGIKEKARIAKGLEFSQTVHNVLGANAVGVWSFNEGLGTIFNDASGYGNHGTNNGVTWTAEGDTPSGNGYALKCDGINDYVSISDSTSLSKLSNTYTLEVWIKPDDLDGWQSIFEKGLGTNPRYMFWTDNDEIGAVGHKGSSPYTETTNMNLKVGVWSHIVFTFDYDANPQARIYKDGVEFTLNNNTGIGQSADTSGHIMRICDTNNQDYEFNGSIDEVKIYNQALIVQ